MLTAETGLEAAEQKLIYRGKERENGEYLEGCGVKNKSKMVLVEDPASIERRYIETKRNAKIQAAHRAISDVSIEVHKLAEQVPIFLFFFSLLNVAFLSYGMSIFPGPGLAETRPIRAGNSHLCREELKKKSPFTKRGRD